MYDSASKVKPALRKNTPRPLQVAGRGYVGPKAGHHPPRSSAPQPVPCQGSNQMWVKEPLSSSSKKYRRRRQISELARRTRMYVPIGIFRRLKGQSERPE